MSQSKVHRKTTLLLVLFVGAVAIGAYIWASNRANTERESYGRALPARVIETSKVETKCQLFGLWCVSWRLAEVRVRVKHKLKFSEPVYYKEVELEASVKKGQLITAWFYNGNHNYARFENEREGSGSFGFASRPWQGGLYVLGMVAAFGAMAYAIALAVLWLIERSSDEEEKRAKKEREDDGHPSRKGVFIACVNAMNILGLIGLVTSKGARKTIFHIYGSISWTDVAYAIIAIVVAMGLVFIQVKLFPVLKWSWTKYLGKDHEGINLSFTTMKIPWFGPVYGGMLFFAIPLIAKLEEEIFRKGTHGWLQGLFMSVLFGMAHCIVGVPLAAGIAISVVGLWLTQNYFWGGLHQSIEVHATYDAILIAMLGVALIALAILDRLERKMTTT